MAKKPDTQARIADNKKAAYNYFFEERFEAGMVLQGWEIKALRENNHVSQPVFARYLNTSESTIQKWETGAKRPSGPALKLLSIVQKHGLQMLS